MYIIINIVIVLLWYLYLNMCFKYKKLQQKNDNNTNSIKMLGKAFDNHMVYIYDKLKEVQKQGDNNEQRKNK